MIPGSINLVSAAMDQGIVTALVLKTQQPVRVWLRKEEKLDPLADQMCWETKETKDWFVLELKEGEERILELPVIRH